ICNNSQVAVRNIERDFTFSVSDKRFYWSGVGAQSAAVALDASMPSLPLPSVACALQVLAWLGLWDGAVFAKALPELGLAGRMEKISYSGREWILDVAHNAAGAQYLSQRLAQENITELVLVFSAMADKDMVSILVALRPLVSHCLVFPLAENPRAATLEQLVAATEMAGFDQNNIVSCKDISQVMAEVCVIAPHLPVLVCGSFFTVAAVAGELLDVA
ncbi:MAG: hypothetical protein R3E61_11700, partial [Pseudomonadales bacterium]